MFFGGFGKGYPATVSSGYSKAVPAYGSIVAPGGFGKSGKPPIPPIPPFGIGKPFGKPIGKGFGKIGFPGAKAAFPGYGATKSSGYSSVVPATTVATSPYPGAI
jgi:hypothetical protein